MIIFKNLNTFIAIILCGMIMPSCALIQTTSESLNLEIKDYLSKNEFDEIDSILNGIDKKKHESIFDQKKHIALQKNKFISNTLTTAKKHKLANKWQLALDTYNRALEKINNEPAITKQRDAILIEIDHQVLELRKEMLMKRANALISYKKTYKKLQQLIPQDYNAQFDINRYDKDRVIIASHLKSCGDQAKKNRKYTLASECYSLSNKLEPTAQKRLWIKNINEKIKLNSNTKRDSELLVAYHAAYKKHEYNKALLHLNTLLAITPSHAQAKKLLINLSKEINEQVTDIIANGKVLYSENKINDALKIWQQALSLDPKNSDLLQLIKRAEKVSRKIQSLEETQ